MKVTALVSKTRGASERRGVNGSYTALDKWGKNKLVSFCCGYLCCHLHDVSEWNLTSRCCD